MFVEPSSANFQPCVFGPRKRLAPYINYFLRHCQRTKQTFPYVHPRVLTYPKAENKDDKHWTLADIDYRDTFS